MVRGKSWLLAGRTAEGVDVGLHWVHYYCVDIPKVSRGGVGYSVSSLYCVQLIREVSDT